MAQPEPNPARVHLADAQRVLALFSEGIAGRYIHLRPTSSLRGEFRPDTVTSDGNAVYLPESFDGFAAPRENFGWYRIAILHQLGFELEGTYSFDFTLARERLQFPVASEHRTERAVDIERFFDCFRAPNLIRRLFMTIEEARIDNAIAFRFPGARPDLQRVMAHSLAQRPDLLTLSSFSFLLEALTRFSLGQPTKDLLAVDATGLLADMLNICVAASEVGASVYDSAQAAVYCYHALTERLVSIQAADRSAQMEDSAELLDDAIEALVKGGGDSDEGSELLVPVDFRGDLKPEAAQRQMRVEDLLEAKDQLSSLDENELSPDALAKILADLEMKEAGEAIDAPEAPGAKGARPRDGTPMSAAEVDALKKRVREQKDALKRAAALDRAVLRRSFGDVDVGVRSFLYDEWDSLNQVYLKGYCRLFEHRLKGDDYRFIHAVHELHADLTHKIKNQFRLLKPESYSRVRRVLEGEELDLDAVIESIVDRKSGQSPEERVFARRDKARREVAAAFLLDMSASTDDVIPELGEQSVATPAQMKDEDEDQFLYGFFNVKRRLEPEVKRRRVIDVAKESLALMCEALETLGDRYAIYGFSGYGREDVEFHVAKEFSERLSPKTWAAISAMKPRRSTRMGPAIRHAYRLLDGQDVRMKVLIMISDGFPQDCDYGPDRTDHEYGIQDTAKALAEAQQRGVQTFCVTIDRAGHDYLRRMCPDSRYLVIDEVAALPDELTKVYRALTL